MAQEYYVDNLISRFIKCLLADTYIPTIDIWKPGKNLVKGFTYITQDKYIVKALNDYKGEGESPKSALDTRYFKIIKPYVEGEFYRGLTSNFQSNSALYDPDTHYMLGQYLRYLRDMHDLDLMSYYNCYSGISSDKYRIKSDSTIEKQNKINDALISYIVPIKANQKYSIYYQSDVPFYILPVYYNGVDIWNVNKNNNSIIKKQKVNRSTIKQPYILSPIIFEGDNLVYESSTGRLLEDYLCLLIQVPKNKYSNLLVLEGDYSNIKTNLNNIDGISKNRVSREYIGKQENIKVNDEEIKPLTVAELNEIFKPLSSLTLNISDINYAFNDRLVEYLLYAPIINKDKIRYNIKRIQDYLSSNKAEEVFGMKFDNTYISDIWDTNLRYYVYNLITQDNKNQLYKDINGYVDKDSEFIIDQAKISGGNFNV